MITVMADEIRYKKDKYGNRPTYKNPPSFRHREFIPEGIVPVFKKGEVIRPKDGQRRYIVLDLDFSREVYYLMLIKTSYEEPFRKMQHWLLFKEQDKYMLAEDQNYF